MTNTEGGIVVFCETEEKPLGIFTNFDSATKPVVEHDNWHALRGDDFPIGHTDWQAEAEDPVHSDHQGSSPSTSSPAVTTPGIARR